jgi:parallel beta-helix repeat protein
MTLEGQGHRIQGEIHLPIGSTQFTQTNEIGGISVSNSYNVMIKNFSIENCKFGVSLDNCSNITLYSLNVTGTWNDLPFSMFPSGIFMWHCNNVNITGNRLENNEYGIYLGEKCTQNLFIGNTISNSKHDGIILYDSSGNTFYHNNFKNEIDFYDSGLDHYGVSLRAVNTWDNGKEGNYWSDYNSTDLNGDGLGDKPYRINLQNVDDFPLMEPFNSTYYLLKTNPPKISLLSPLNWVYNDSSVPLVFNVDKSVNWTNYSLDGQQNVTFSGNTNLTDISNGLHNVTVYAQDTFGNIGSSQTISFTIAKQEPESFPVVPVAAIAVAVITLITLAGLLVYHKKHKRSLVKKH